jgi:hypothetical protein
MAHYEDNPRHSPPSEEESPERREVVGRFVDLFKRAVSAGAGAIFSDDDKNNKDSREGREGREGRERRGAFELPKEVIQYFLGALDGMQESILRIIGNELRKFLEHVDIGGELQKILTSTSFEIKTEIRFIPNDQAVSPSVKARMRVKRQKEDSETITEQDL